MKAKRCQQCKMKFKPKRYWAKFCSSLCRQQWHEHERKEALALLAEVRKK